MPSNQTRSVRLATRAPQPTGRAARAPKAPFTRVAHDQELRRHYAARFRTLVPKGTLTAATPGRWIYDDQAPGTLKRSPAGDLAADLLWIIRTRLQAGHAPADIRRDVQAFVADLLGECTGVLAAATGTLPAVVACDVAETLEQAEADVAVRRYVSCAADAPPEERERLLDLALAESHQHVAAALQLCDRLAVQRFELRQQRRQAAGAERPAGERTLRNGARLFVAP